MSVNGVPGMRTSRTRPPFTRHPLTARITPPAATVEIGSSMKGRDTVSSAPGSRMESESTNSTRSSRARLTPTLVESERPELRLCTTVSRVRPSRGT